MGIERCLLTLDALGIELPIPDERPFAFLITLGEEAVVRPVAVKLLAELRAAGIAADMDYKSRKFGPQVKRSDDLGARYTLILGEGELERGVLGLRDQATKEQRDVPLSEVVAELSRLSQPSDSE